MDEDEYIQQSLLQEGPACSLRTVLVVSVVKKKVEKHQSSLESLPDGVLSFLLSSFLDLPDAVHASFALAATCTDLRRRMREIVGPSMRVKADLGFKADLGYWSPVAQYIMLLKLSTARIGLEELHLTVGNRDLHLLALLIDVGFLECRSMLKFGITKCHTFGNCLFPLRQPEHRMSQLLTCCYMEDSPIVDNDSDFLIQSVVQKYNHLQSLSLFISVEDTPGATGELTKQERSLSKGLPNLQHLTVVFSSERFEGNSLHIAIEKLDRLVTSIPNLKVLKVGTSTTSDLMRTPLPRDWFRLRSDTLQLVDFRMSAAGIFVDSVVCPKLKIFQCRGRGNYSYGNGVRPWDPGTHDDAKDGKFFSGITTSQRSGYCTIAEQSFYGMQVPNNCIVQFQHEEW
jgi:hypothetical protein